MNVHLSGFSFIHRDQRTFIHRDLSEKLQLKVLGEEELKIFAFGDQSAITRTKTRRVELSLRSQYDDQGVRVKALEVPCICADIMATPSNSVLLELSRFHFQVADASQGGGSENIDLSIGADHYCEIVTGSTKRLSSRLMAVKTVFGWTVQGQVGTRKSTGVCSSAAGVIQIGVSEQTDKETSLLRESELWWRGPRWLQEDDTHWPTISESSSKVAECQMEERRVTVIPIVSSPSMAILNVENYSSFSRVVRVTAWYAVWSTTAARKRKRRSAHYELKK
ncbi:hypothetical protein HPB49_006599 [Dermacentor silvarum]|uniref:Uncharacterized protein n=1 Tax=Dermacentor silvarum TaxID=543639 RepID=A0ACB8DWG2_DERSI|nr:hypothetical protein HPB49_006599 [Dermacentor silvarum]